MSPTIHVLREDDPQHALLLAQGWRVVATSWGARLRLSDDADLTGLHAAVDRVSSDGYELVELGPGEAEEATTLDDACAADYPWTPATGHEPLDAAALAAHLDGDGWRVFGARYRTPSAGVAEPTVEPPAHSTQPVARSLTLVAITLTCPMQGRTEVDRTCVAAGHRRRGLATAIKAASILAGYAAGQRVWGTGGAAVNAGSLAANRALGFELEPLWHSLEEPA